MIIDGQEVDDLDAVIELIPTLVPGRYLQLDGDMLCYECGYNDDEPFASVTRNFKTALNTRMAMAGAEFCLIHLTGAHKGGRFDTALVKAYQENRSGKPKPKHLPALRAWVQEHYRVSEGCAAEHHARACMHNDQEADDGMASAQYDFIKCNRGNLSIIMSGDKDLGICSGLHCDWKTYAIEEVHGFGSIRLSREGSATKIKGKGTAFFWAQLLMGDTADNIPGLPNFGAPITAAKFPSATFSEATRLLAERTTKTGKPASALQVAKALGAVDEAKPKLCGPVAVYEYLKDCTNDMQCFIACVKAYKSHYGEQPFTFNCWRGAEYTLTAGHMLLEQARLLWMRRVTDECPSAFFKEVVQGTNWIGVPSIA